MLPALIGSLLTSAATSAVKSANDNHQTANDNHAVANDNTHAANDNISSHKFGIMGQAITPHNVSAPKPVTVKAVNDNSMASADTRDLLKTVITTLRRIGQSVDRQNEITVEQIKNERENFLEGNGNRTIAANDNGDGVANAQEGGAGIMGLLMLGAIGGIAAYTKELREAASKIGEFVGKIGEYTTSIGEWWRTNISEDPAIQQGVDNLPWKKDRPAERAERHDWGLLGAVAEGIEKDFLHPEKYQDERNEKYGLGPTTQDHQGVGNYTAADIMNDRAGVAKDIFSGKAGAGGQYGGEGLPNKYAKFAKSDPAFHKEVMRVSKKYNIRPVDLYGVIDVETSGTFSPSIKNPGSSASGLIQFMDSTAKRMGTTTGHLRSLSRADQMKWVDKYFSMNGLGRIKRPSAGDLYTIIAGPARLGKNYVYKRGTKEYAQNRRTWDLNKDGFITSQELGTAVTRRSHLRARQGGVQTADASKPTQVSFNNVSKPVASTLKPAAHTSHASASNIHNNTTVVTPQTQLASNEAGAASPDKSLGNLSYDMYFRTA